MHKYADNSSLLFIDARMKGTILTSLVLLGSCSNAPAKAPANQSEVLDQIVIKCHLPRSSFKLSGADEVQFRPPANADYEDVDCSLRELQKSPFSMRLSFVGNEAVRKR